MLKASKYRIYPNIAQIRQITDTFGCCRSIYNKMLEERKIVYDFLKDDKTALYAYKYKTEAEYKAEFDYMKKVDSVALQQSRINLQSSYKNFTTNKAGFPNFKRRDGKQSYRTVNTNNNIRIDFDNRTIKIPKVGRIKFRDSRTFTGKINSVTLSRNTFGQYFVSVLAEDYEAVPAKIDFNKNSKVVSLDMSAKNFAVSEEKQFTNEHFYRDSEPKIKRLHKNLSRKQKSSKNKEKSRLRLAKFYLKISNRRTD